MEGNQPDAKGLGHSKIHYQIFVVVCWGSYQHIIAGEENLLWYIPIELILISICGLSILYHLKIACTKFRLFWKDGTRQNGCTNDASGVKYVSTASSCLEGDPCVRRWTTLDTSRTGALSVLAKQVVCFPGLPGFSIAFKIAKSFRKRLNRCLYILKILAALQGRSCFRRVAGCHFHVAAGDDVPHR